MWGRAVYFSRGLAHRSHGHPATAACVSAAREVHQPAADELQRHGDEEGGAAHGARCLHRVPAREAGERREESNYRYLLGNQLIKIQNKVRLDPCAGSESSTVFGLRLGAGPEQSSF